MTADDLTAALRACAAGLYPLEAGVALLIANGTFLHRGDFTSRFIDHGTSNGTAMACDRLGCCGRRPGQRGPSLLRRRAACSPAVGQPRRRDPRRPPRRHHRPRRQQRRPADHRDSSCRRETTRDQRILMTAFSSEK